MTWLKSITIQRKATRWPLQCLTVVLLWLLALSPLEARNEDKIAQRIIDLAKIELERHYPSPNYRVEVEIRRLPKVVERLSVSEIQGIRFQNTLDPKGYERIQVVAKNQPSLSRISAQVQLNVKVWQHLPVLRQKRKGGENVLANHLQMDWVDISRLTGPFLQDVDQLNDQMVLARLLQKGQPIRLQEFISKPVVQAGDPVKLIMEKSGFRIEILCTARQDGAVGDEIRCYSNENRTTYTATVLDKGLAQWKHTY